MKRFEIADVFNKRPRIYAVFRVTSKKSWLVKQKIARIGEEFVFAKDSVGLTCVGPLIPGTTKLAPGADRYNPGPPAHWSFMEYRIVYNEKAWEAVVTP